MIVKLIAIGFVDYIRNGWNVLDFFLNIYRHGPPPFPPIIHSSFYYSIVSLFPVVWNLSIIRAFRALATIRIFRSMPGLKAIVDALVFSIPHLLDIGVLMLFLFMVYALTGMQMWLGTMRQRCFDDSTGLVESVDRLCSIDPTYGRQCPSGYSCLGNMTDNPGYGFMSFDNVAVSLLTLFGLTATNSGWSSVMYYVR